MLQSSVRRGELDREITFIKKVITTPDTNEDKITNWVPVDVDPYVFSRVKEKQGKEVVIADRLTYVQDTIFTVDHRTDITVENRVVYRAKPYNIISITDNESGRERYIDIVASIIDNEVYT